MPGGQEMAHSAEFPTGRRDHVSRRDAHCRHALVALCLAPETVTHSLALPHSTSNRSVAIPRSRGHEAGLTPRQHLYRNKGIGKQLTVTVTAKARSPGATARHISAIPSRTTAEACLRMGVSVLATPDSVLFAEEPEDIHLLLQISESSLPAE